MNERGALPTAVAVALLLLAGTLLLVRAFDGTPSIGGDNAGYLILARSLLEGEGFRDLYLPGAPLHTKYPPLYPLLLAGWMAAGAQTWVHFALLSAVLVLGAAVAVLLWAAERHGLLFGFGLSFLLLLSPAFQDAAAEILSEPLFLLLTFGGLWAAERGGRATRRPGASEEGGGGWTERRWLWVAGAAAILAWWTRSAGLPLVLAIGGVLLLRRRWRSAAVFAVAFLVPAALWWLRGRGVAGDGAGYLSELWMVNPYRPDLGVVGPAEMLGRVVENLRLYVTLWIPQGLTGGEGAWVPPLGLLLSGLAVAGWLRSLRRRVGVTELFLLLYLGVLLLWPQVWASQRFALPLLPLILLYAGGALGDAVGWLETRWSGGAGRSGVRDPDAGGARAGGSDGGGSGAPDPGVFGAGSRWAGPVVAALAALLLLAPAGASWWERGQVTRFCRAAAERAGPFGCYAEPVREYAAAALWSGLNLPEDAVVLTRKPRIFHVMSGRTADVFPFTDRPEAFADSARIAGASHVIVDYIDAQASRYLVPVVLERPDLFCTVRGFGADPSARTHLLGVDPDLLGTTPGADPDPLGTTPGGESEATDEPGSEDDGRVSLRACPPSMGTPIPTGAPRSPEGEGDGPEVEPETRERIPDLTDPRIPFLGMPVRRPPRS